MYFAVFKEEQAKMPSLSVNLQIKQQAHHWVRCLNRGLTDNEKPQLIAWINQNPTHHQALYQSASIFDNLNELNELNGIFSLEMNKRRVSKQYTPTSITLFVLVCLAIIYVVAGFLTSSNQGGNAINTYFTSIGEVKNVQLPDGSAVTLNTNSKITVDYNTSYRSINLLHGEAQFDVATEKTRPFTVSAGTKSFTALGTIFNIQKNNELDMELIVNEGEVLISESHYSKQQLADFIQKEASKFDSREIITTGEKTIIENSIAKPTILLADSTSNDLAWQQGMIVFNGEYLKQALTEVSRYTDMQFEIISPEISHIKVSGYYKANDINSLLRALANNFPIHYKFNATNSVQLSKANKD